MRRHAYSRSADHDAQRAVDVARRRRAAPCASRRSSKLASSSRHPPRLVGTAEPARRPARPARRAPRRARRGPPSASGRRGQLLPTELAQRLQLAVAVRPCAGDHHRLVDEHAEQPGDVDARRCRCRRTPARPVRASNDAREHREPVEQPLLDRREQVVGPLHEIAQRAVPRVGGAPRAGEHPEALGQPLGELRRAHRPHPRRRQLERERHAVEPDADLGDRGAVVVVEHEVRLRRPGPLHEQLHRGARRRASSSGSSTLRRHRQRRHRPHHLGGDAERLAAGGEHLHVGAPPQHQLDQLAGRCRARARSCRARAAAYCDAEQLDDRVGERPVRPLLHVERGGDRGGDRALVAHRRRARPGARRRRTGRDGVAPAGARAGSCRRRPGRTA